MNIVFFGRSKFVFPLIQQLEKKFQLSLVVTTDKEASDSVPSFCKKNKIKCLSVSNFSVEIIEDIKKINAPIAVLADFGLLIPRTLEKIFPKGILNIHPSLLPKYRGPTPVQTAILKGEKTTGISIMKIDEEIDHGPILVQESEEILKDDTSESLYERLFKKGAELLSATIEDYLNDGIKPVEQNHSEATFSQKLTRDSGFFNLENSPNHDHLERMIRAFYPWPGVWTKAALNGKSVIVKFLPDNKIQVEGKNPVTVKDFLNGYSKIPNPLRKLIQ